MKKFLSVLLVLIVSAAAFAESAVMLRDKGPLRIDDVKKGGAVWSITVPAGTSLELKDSKPVVRTMITSKGNIDNCNFYRVKYNNKEYLALEGEILIGKPAGLLLRDTVLFSKPQFSSFVNARLEKATVVGIGKTVVNNGVKFVEVCYYSDSLKNRYILEETYVIGENDLNDFAVKTISTNKDDLTAMLLMAKAAADDDMDNKLTNIKNALNLSLSQEIEELVKAEFYKNFKDDEPVVPAAPVAESKFVYESYDAELEIWTGDSDNARIREEPKTGTVLGAYPDRTSLHATKVAYEKQDGTTVSVWYYVSIYGPEEELSGWISGSLVRTPR